MPLDRSRCTPRKDESETLGAGPLSSIFGPLAGSGSCQSAELLFKEWRDKVLSDDPPTLYPAAKGELSRIEIGPNLVTLIGGAPGSGKTALVMQLTIDALRMNPNLRALVCNVEMPPPVLLDRQLARLSGVNLSKIRHRRLGDAEHDRINNGFETLGTVIDRLTVVKSPYTLENVAASADDANAGLILLDYIQRIRPPGTPANARTSVNATMDYIRHFADAGVAVLVVSAVGRTKDAEGRSSYSGESMSLASFRESSELEYGADDAYILHTEDDDRDSEIMLLRHLKSRHGDQRDIRLQFTRSIQRFSDVPEETQSQTVARRLGWQKAGVK